jgi:hypothetical protein
LTWQAKISCLKDATKIHQSLQSNEDMSDLLKQTLPKTMNGLPSAVTLLFLILCGLANGAQAASLPVSTFNGLASSCAAGISSHLLEAVARTESGLDPLALHENTTGESP